MGFYAIDSADVLRRETASHGTVVEQFPFMEQQEVVTELEGEVQVVDDDDHALVGIPQQPHDLQLVCDVEVAHRLVH